VDADIIMDGPSLRNKRKRGEPMEERSMEEQSNKKVKNAMAEGQQPGRKGMIYSAHL
jgi:hypothetical protein